MLPVVSVKPVPRVPQPHKGPTRQSHVFIVPQVYFNTAGTKAKATPPNANYKSVCFS